MKIDQLTCFLDVVELGTFTAAASRAGKSQPAVSLQMRQLEASLGLTLLERVGKRVRPTPAGLELAQHARRILETVEVAKTSLASFTENDSGYVRLGTGATACIHLLPPALKSLKANFPWLNVTVKTGDTPEILKSLEDNLIDIALVTMPVKGRSLYVEPLMLDEFIFIAPKGTGKLPKRISATDLFSSPLILYATGGHTRQIVDRWLSVGGKTPRPFMDLASVEAIKGMVAAGQGCAILPRSSFGNDLATPDFEVRSLHPPLSRELAIVVRQDKPRHVGLRRMKSALEMLKAVGLRRTGDAAR